MIRADNACVAAVGSGGWRKAEGVAGQPRKAAGPALAHRREFEHVPDRLALALRG